MTVPLLFMEDKDEKTLSPLEARVAFAGMLDNAEKWARGLEKKSAAQGILPHEDPRPD